MRHDSSIIKIIIIYLQHNSEKIAILLDAIGMDEGRIFHLPDL